MQLPYAVRTDGALTVRFSATVDEEPEIQVGLVYWLGAQVSRHERVQEIYSEAAPSSQLSLQYAQALRWVA